MKNVGDAALEIISILETLIQIPETVKTKTAIMQHTDNVCHCISSLVELTVIISLKELERLQMMVFKDAHGIHNSSQVMDVMIKCRIPGLNINAALFYMCKYSNQMNDPIASLLSERDIHVNVQNNTGWTPLMYVCIEGQEAIAKSLLKHPKINVNLYNNDAKTGLIHACLSNRERIVKVLLERQDIDINFNHKGWTALAYACQFGRRNIVKLLLQRHDICNTITASDGKTPYDISKGRLSKDVRVILKILRHPRRTSYLEVR